MRLGLHVLTTAPPSYGPGDPLSPGLYMSSIQMELAFGAGVAVEDESFVFCIFVTAITRYNRSDL